MLCKTCGDDFHTNFSNDVKLTIVCRKCATSNQFVTQTAALGMGARRQDLEKLECRQRLNPMYSSASFMKLYVFEEVEVFAAINEEKRIKRVRTKGALSRARASRRESGCKMREEAYKKRMDDLENLRGVVPTPGLVAGDFCSLQYKTPRTSVKSLVSRKSLWNRCSALEIPVALQVFNWAVTNKRTDGSVVEALRKIDHEKFLFDKVATVEGHRVLSFLDRTDRFVLMNVNPVFEESRFDLGVQEISHPLCKLVVKIAGLLDVPFAKVLRKISLCGWLRIHLDALKTRPERVASILRPHFLSKAASKRMLISDMEASFREWGLTSAHIVHEVKYLSGHVVDVELFSASCYLVKSGVKDLRFAIPTITWRVMCNAGDTWMHETKEYTREHLENAHMLREDIRLAALCLCGKNAALRCRLNKCANCCQGPCTRHSVRI